MPGQEPIHLFVYGTLKDPERVFSLTGKHFAGIPATLSGFERVESPLGYPFISPQPHAVVHGLLLRHIDPASLLRLDVYEAEGDLYRRHIVEVESVGTRLSAMTYVGLGVRASLTGFTIQASNPEPSDRGQEITIPIKRLPAPYTDEH